MLVRANLDQTDPGGGGSQPAEENLTTPLVYLPTAPVKKRGAKQAERPLSEGGTGGGQHLKKGLDTQGGGDRGKNLRAGSRLVL